MAGFPRPKKVMGQHFLTDGRFVNQIIECAEISSKDVIVEIGPGKGVLTKALAERARRVVAIEIDSELTSRLEASLSKYSNVSIINGDGRRLEIESVIPKGQPYKFVANLPYYAATPIVQKFLKSQHKPDLMAFMIQREVGYEMAAKPGKMRLLSVAIQMHGKPKIICKVPPTAFKPVPKVTSVIMQVRPFKQIQPLMEFEEEFFRLVKAGFSAPRKQLKNSLSSGLGMSSVDVGALLKKSNIDVKRRAETVCISEWDKMFRIYRSMG